MAIDLRGVAGSARGGKGGFAASGRKGTLVNQGTPWRAGAKGGTTSWTSLSVGKNAGKRSAPAVPVVPRVPLVRQSLVRQPLVQRPMVRQPPVQRPIVRQPVVRRPMVQQPMVRQTIVRQTVVRQPVVQRPVVRQPVVSSPQHAKGSGGKSGVVGCGQKGAGKGKKGSSGHREFPIKCKVWIGNAPDPCDWKALQEHMMQAGHVKHIWVARGRGGCAYSSEDEAEAAVALLSGSTFQDMAIEVDVWTKKEADA